MGETYSSVSIIDHRISRVLLTAIADPLGLYDTSLSPIKPSKVQKILEIICYVPSSGQQHISIQKNHRVRLSNGALHGCKLHVCLCLPLGRIPLEWRGIATFHGSTNCD